MTRNARKNCVDAAFDRALAEYVANPHVIFSDDSERKGKLHSSAQKKVQDWNKRKDCIFSACSKKSIRRSHTIQKSGPLASISKNATVLTPQFDHRIGKIRLVPRGLSQASVFPGFCEEHERLFYHFENTKRIEGNEAISLQIYRSICREIVQLEHNLSHIETQIADYIELRNRKLSHLAQKHIGRHGDSVNGPKIQSLNFSPDPHLTTALASIEDSRAVLNELRTEHLRELERDISGHTNDTLRPVVIDIDIVLPVTLSGVGSFYVTSDNGPCRVLAVLGVYPDQETGCTTIVIHGKSADTPNIHGYVREHGTRFQLLNMVEQFMIRGTDHWFLTPSVWNRKLPEEQNKILAEILDERKGILHPIPLSMFDEIRELMIRAMESSGSLSPSDQEVIAREKVKLNAF